MKIDFAKASAPRVHGNGFLQIDIAPGTRLHIWGHSKLPRQVVDTSIHDHRFSFESEVIAGRLVNAQYNRGHDYRYRIFEPQTREGEDTTLHDTGRRIGLSVSPAKIVRCGEKYEMPARAFHESFSDRPSATVMRKTFVFNYAPRVLVPDGAEPDNEFNRYDYPEDYLWGIVQDVLGYV